MKLYGQKYPIDYSGPIVPMAEIGGFPVRPGLFDVNGAMAFQGGVNFTIHTHAGTNCQLLLFHNGEEEPYAAVSYTHLDVYKRQGLLSGTISWELMMWRSTVCR